MVDNPLGPVRGVMFGLLIVAPFWTVLLFFVGK